MKKYLLFCLSCLLALSLWAQERTVTGTVTDAETGEPVPGANVVEKGTTNGTITDFNGQYKLAVGDNATLIFSFVGYTPQEVEVGSRAVIDMSMELDVTALSEVVVIGYGETTIKDATGAVAAVSSEDFNNGIISSPEQLIQGKTAGVQITSTSGAPGAGVQLRIRGTTSIRSNNNPLFVVDGVPLSGGTTAASADVGFGTTADTNPLNFINPSDIQSISILKDASATAIYGSRGANGVVIITTKSGKGNKGSLDFTSSLSISEPANKYDLLGRDQYLTGVANLGGAPQDAGADTDWQDVITRTSISNKQNLSYAKGFQTASIRASLGYEDQQGILENSYMKRLTGRINASKSLLNDRLNIDLSSTYSHVKREDPAISGNAGSTGDLLGSAYSANPTWPDDPEFGDTFGKRNPANMLEEYKSTGSKKRFLTNVSADYKLSDALTAKATYGIDFSDGDRVTLITGDAINIGNNNAGRGQGQINENVTTSNLVELTLNYNKEVGDVRIDVVGGYSLQSFRNQYSWYSGKGFTDPSSFNSMEDELRSSYDAAAAAASEIYNNIHNWGVSDNLSNGDAGDPTAGGFVSGFDGGNLERNYFARPEGTTVKGIAANFYDQTDYLQSYFGRANFTISDKYLITATLRIDGSSKFGPDNRYGVFPSGAVAWKLHEEDFMPDFFSTFKLRAGYGIVGNQDGIGYGNFIRRERYADAGVGDNNEIGIPPTTTLGFANPGLKWESTEQTGVGVDFGFLRQRISGSFDYYIKNTSDLLLNVIVAQPALATQVFTNLDANVQNKGWELGLEYLIMDNTDASFSIGGNVSHNKNEVQDFGGLIDAGTIYGPGLTNAYAQRVAEGQPLFSYFVREFNGFDENGQPIGDQQKFVGKSALPTWNTGISLNAGYKAFDLAMFFAGQFGHYIYNNTQNAFFTAGTLATSGNVTTDVLGSDEAGNAEASVSERFLYKGDFMRMQNLTIGYNVPMSDGGFIKRLRLSFNAQNLFVITNYNGLDPEVSSSPADLGLKNGIPTAGIDYTAYPRPRTFTFSLNASF